MEKEIHTFHVSVHILTELPVHLWTRLRLLASFGLRSQQLHPTHLRTLPPEWVCRIECRAAGAAAARHHYY